MYSVAALDSDCPTAEGVPKCSLIANFRGWLRKFAPNAFSFLPLDSSSRRMISMACSCDIPMDMSISPYSSMGMLYIGEETSLRKVGVDNGEVIWSQSTMWF